MGDFGNVYGAIVGGFLFASLQTVGAVLMPFASAYKDVFAFGVVIVIMAVKPTGLLDEKEAQRVGRHGPTCRTPTRAQPCSRALLARPAGRGSGRPDRHL